MDLSEEHDDLNISPDKPGIGAHPARCPVVGVGASAGGLEAFQNLLAAVPADSGNAYVLVQHLDPNHESMLAELLSRRTEMEVRQVSNGMAIEPNNVYLIPPNASLIVEKLVFACRIFPNRGASAGLSTCFSEAWRSIRDRMPPALFSRGPAVTGARGFAP